MSKRKIIKLLLALLFILAGVFLFIYPRFTDYAYKSEVTKLEDNYSLELENINSSTESDKLEELYDLLKKENDEVYKTHEYRFLTKKDYELTDINLSDYGLTNNIFGFIEIPSINITLPIYFGSSEENMRLGATHLTGTSYPIGGVNSSSVIAAHRGYYKTEMFRNIDKIKSGDKLYLRTPYGRMEYVAYKTTIIKPTELDKLTIVEGQDLVTLISCHPFPTNRERYVVYFKRV